MHIPHEESPQMTQKTLRQTLEQLQTTVVPDARLTRPKINRTLAAQQNRTGEEIRDALEIGALEQEKLRLILEILNHPEFEQMINEGRITFGMVKPHREQAHRIPDGTDEENTEKVIEAIRPPLEVVIRQDFPPTAEMMREFYRHLRDLDEDGAIINRVVNFMTSSSPTALVLFNPKGDAIKEWRDQMGPTRADPREEGETLRHRFGNGVENNAVHGSDSIESVKRELALFKELLELLQA